MLAQGHAERQRTEKNWASGAKHPPWWAAPDKLWTPRLLLRVVVLPPAMHLHDRRVANPRTEKHPLAGVYRLRWQEYGGLTAEPSRGCKLSASPVP